MGKKKEISGVMLYFDIRPMIDYLSMEDRGELLTAILDYGEQGLMPDFQSGLLGMAWAAIRPRIDANRDAYAEKCEKNAYNAYTRSYKERGENPPTFEEWQASKEQNNIPDAANASERKRTQPTKNNSKLTPTYPNDNPNIMEIKNSVEGGTGGERNKQTNERYHTPDIDEDPDAVFETRRDAAMQMLNDYELR